MKTIFSIILILSGCVTHSYAASGPGGSTGGLTSNQVVAIVQANSSGPTNGIPVTTGIGYGTTLNKAAVGATNTTDVPLTVQPKIGTATNALEVKGTNGSVEISVTPTKLELTNKTILLHAAKDDGIQPLLWSIGQSNVHAGIGMAANTNDIKASSTNYGLLTNAVNGSHDNALNIGINIEDSPYYEPGYPGMGLRQEPIYISTQGAVQSEIYLWWRTPWLKTTDFPLGTNFYVRWLGMTPGLFQRDIDVRMAADRFRIGSPTNSDVDYLFADLRDLAYPVLYLNNGMVMSWDGIAEWPISQAGIGIVGRYQSGTNFLAQGEGGTVNNRIIFFKGQAGGYTDGNDGAYSLGFAYQNTGWLDYSNGVFHFTDWGQPRRTLASLYSSNYTALSAGTLTVTGAAAVQGNLTASNRLQIPNVPGTGDSLAIDGSGYVLATNRASVLTLTNSVAGVCVVDLKFASTFRLLALAETVVVFSNVQAGKLVVGTVHSPSNNVFKVSFTNNANLRSSSAVIVGVATNNEAQYLFSADWTGTNLVQQSVVTNIQPLVTWPVTVPAPFTQDGIVLWLAATNITGKSDGESLAGYTWNDLSGAGHHFYASNSPQYSISNGASVFFNGNLTSSNHWFQSDVFMSSYTEGEIFMRVRVSNDPSIDTEGGLWNFGSGVTSYFPYTDGNVYDSFGTSVRKTVGDPTPTLSAWRTYNVISTASEWTANMDGSQIYTTGINVVGWATDNAMIGMSGTGNAAMHGWVSEVIMFNRKLTSDERATVNSYIGR